MTYMYGAKERLGIQPRMLARTSWAKLREIERIARDYAKGTPPYGDDPEMGAPSAMAEISAVLDDRESPAKVEKRVWVALGEEAKASIGQERYDVVHRAVVEIVEVTHADEHGCEVLVKVLEYRGDPSDTAVARRNYPVGSTNRIGYGVLITPQEKAGM